jgi:hypothetical protein
MVCLLWDQRFDSQYAWTTTPNGVTAFSTVSRNRKRSTLESERSLRTMMVLPGDCHVTDWMVR